MHCLKGMKSDKTMTKTVILHQNLFLISEELTLICSTSHWDQIQRNNNAITRATKQLIPVKIFAVLHDLENRS